MTRRDAFPYTVGPLGVGDLIDNALYIWRDNFTILFLLGAAVMMPADILVGAGVDFFLARRVPMVDGDLYSFSVMRFPMAGIVADAVITSAIFATVAEAAGYRFLGARYIGEPVTMRASLATALRFAPRLIPIHMLFYLMRNTLSLFCFPISMVFYGVFLLRIPVIVNENQRSVYGFFRGVQLLKGHWRHVVVVMVTLFIATFPLSMALGLSDAPVLGRLVGPLIRAFLLGFEVSVVTALYFSARSQNEHMDLDLIARRVDADLSETNSL